MLAGGLGCSRQPSAKAEFESATELFHKGEFAAAEKQAEAGCRRFQNGPQREWFWKFKLLRAEMILFGAAGKPNELLAEPPPAEYGEPSARYKMLRAWLLFRENKDAEAEDLLNAGIAEAHAIGAYAIEADAEELLASRLVFSDNLDRAEEAADRGFKTASRHHLDYEQAAGLVDLGMVRLKRQHYGDAMPYFESAKTLAEKIGARKVRTASIQNMADCYSSVGDLDQALQMQSQVVAANKQQGAPSLLSAAYFELGNLYLSQGNTRLSVDAFGKAVKNVDQKVDAAQYAKSASGLAQALLAAGSLDEAEDYNRRAFQAADKTDQEQLAFLTLNKAELAERRGRDAEAIRSYSEALAIGKKVPSALWEAYAGLGGEYAKEKDLRSASANFESALRIIEETRAEQLKSAYQITFLSSLIRVYQEYVSVLMPQGEVERAIEVADSSRASVLTQSVNGTRVARSERLVRDIQRQAKLSNTVFLFYWLAPERSYLWVLTANAVKAIELPDQRTIARDVGSYLALVVNEKRDPLTMPGTVGKRLYQTLIAPAAAWLPPGSRVVIIPDGPLHNLNFEMLVNGKPAPHYWIEDAVVSVAPSLGILRAGNAARDATGRSLLLIGDPEPVAGYSKLPQAAVEVEDVEHHFPAANTVVYQGGKATVESYRGAEPNKFSSIHFTAHAEANEQSPLDSAIVLSPSPSGYKLYARDVMEIPLTADLVTISGCRGAGARALSGEGLVGFAWAFFQAGARNVVTSLWDVNDRKTAELMNRFYERVEMSEPYEKALREAKLAMLKAANGKPYYWAPFQLYTRDAPHN